MLKYKRFRQGIFNVSTDAYISILRCKLECEDYLMPNVGGYFVQNFVANIYHYLQYAYYKSTFLVSDHKPAAIVFNRDRIVWNLFTCVFQ